MQTAFLVGHMIVPLHVERYTTCITEHCLQKCTYDAGILILLLAVKILGIPKNYDSHLIVNGTCICISNREIYTATNFLNMCDFAGLVTIYFS